MSNNSGNVFLALLTGAAIGAGIGVLYAPDKGSKTRDKIKQKALDAKTDVQQRVALATDELGKAAQAKRADFERKLDESISTMSYKADDIIATLERKLADLRKKNTQLQK